MGRRLLLVMAVVCSVGLLLVLGQFPLTAQDIIFVTNTPAVAAPLLCHEYTCIGHANRSINVAAHCRAAPAGDQYAAA